MAEITEEKTLYTLTPKVYKGYKGYKTANRPQIRPVSKSELIDPQRWRSLEPPPQQAKGEAHVPHAMP